MSDSQINAACIVQVFLFMSVWQDLRIVRKQMHSMNGHKRDEEESDWATDQPRVLHSERQRQETGANISLQNVH